MHRDEKLILPVLRDRALPSEQPRRYRVPLRDQPQTDRPASRLFGGLKISRYAVSGALQQVRLSWKDGGLTTRSNVVSIVLLLFVFIATLALSAGALFAVVRTLLLTSNDFLQFIEAEPHLQHAQIGKILRSVSSSKIRPGVSVVAACMNRHDTLRQTLPTWLDVPNVNEVVVVDWASSPPLLDLIQNVTRDRRVKVVRVENEKNWVLSRAYNLGVGAASRERILRTDCDYAIHRGFVQAHSLKLKHADHLPEEQGRSHFFAGNFNKARNENEVHLNGAVYIRRDHFMRVGGYDERIQTYGWDDEDLYRRLAAANVEKQDVDYDHVKHVPHTDGSRVQKDVKFAQVEIDLNQLVLEHLEPWSVSLSISEDKNKRATQWQVLSKNPSLRYITVTALSSPKGLQDQVSGSQLDEEWDLALGRRLSNEFHIPWDIMATMDSATKRNLLQRLYRAAAGRSDDSTPKILFAHVQHGLGNRLRAFASAMAFAKHTNRVLVLIWETDAHISAQFSDLFETDLPVITKFKPSWPFTEHFKFDKSWRMILGYNYMEVEGNGAVKDAHISDDQNMHIYFKSSSIMKTDDKLSNWELDNDMLRSLKPVKLITDKVNHLQQNFNLSQRIGVHIRDRTLARDIDHVNFSTEYGVKASATMDYWRHKSSHKVFAAEMRKLVQKDPSATFYVATDTTGVTKYFEKEFPGKILYTARDCDGRDGHCVRFALVDILALSKTKSLYGSNWSSFTEAAERFGGLKAKLAGQDFARDGKAPS